MKALAGTVALAAAALVLGGCETADMFGPGDAALPCPGVRLLADAGAFSRLADGSAPGAGADPAEVAFEARIAGFEALCEYADSDDPAGGMTLAVTVFLAAERDPAIAAAAAGGPVPWFVAAVAPDGTVASKQVFAAGFAFEEPDGGIASAEPAEVDVRFPAGAARAPWEYDIAVGFQLDPAQLEFQRARRR